MLLLLRISLNSLKFADLHPRESEQHFLFKLGKGTGERGGRKKEKALTQFKMTAYISMDFFSEQYMATSTQTQSCTFEVSQWLSKIKKSREGNLGTLICQCIYHGAVLEPSPQAEWLSALTMTPGSHKALLLLGSSKHSSGTKASTIRFHPCSEERKRGLPSCSSAELQWSSDSVPLQPDAMMGHTCGQKWAVSRMATKLLLFLTPQPDG